MSNTQTQHDATVRPSWRSQVAAAVQRPDLAPEYFLGAAIFICWVVIYYDTFVLLATRWNNDPNYSHGFLVPLVSLYLAYQTITERSAADADLTPRGKNGLFAGLAVVGFGGVLQMLTILLPSLILKGLSMLTMLAGLVLLIGGRKWWKFMWAPLLFAFFMIPLPSAIYSRIAFPLQLFVSQISSATMEIVGIPVHRDGNLIYLPGQVMHVAEACSGLRQLTAFIAICTCAALLMARPRWYRIVLLLSSIPIAVLINVMRVTGTGLLIRFGDLSWTEGSLHTIEGLVMVGLGLLVLRMEVALLDWLLVDDTPDAPSLAATTQ